jgi:hypothetical protein
VGRNAVQLNAKQIEILAWVRDGAPASRYPDGYAHRIVARALNNRGFVRIDGHGACWSIRITEAGLAWFEKPLAPAEPQISDLDQLVVDVLEAGGSLDVELGEARPDYARLVSGSTRSAMRPPGKKLELQQRGALQPHPSKSGCGGSFRRSRRG